jgi:hypothetical protein
LIAVNQIRIAGAISASAPALNRRLQHEQRRRWLQRHDRADAQTVQIAGAVFANGGGSAEGDSTAGGGSSGGDSMNGNMATGGTTNPGSDGGNGGAATAATERPVATAWRARRAPVAAAAASA